MGQPDFRVGGHIFATLASAKQGYGNLQLTLDQQQSFVEELPEIFLPIPGGWGRMGMTTSAWPPLPKTSSPGPSKPPTTSA